jgi:predicted transcriptional regulator of viral defense system
MERSLSQAKSSQESIDRDITRLAGRQYGLFSRTDVVRVGGTKAAIDWRIAIGRWERVKPHVYRLAGAAASWRQSLLAACMSWGDDASASHGAAAALFKLAAFKPVTIELIVPRGRWRKEPGVIIHRTALSAVDRTIIAGIPVTTPARTLIDLASCASADAVEEALDDALRRKLVSLSRMRWRLDALTQRGRPGIVTMRRLLDAREPAKPVPQSVLETRMLRVLMRAGLPKPALQHEIRDRGRLVAIVDFAYPDVRLAIEADGYRWHTGRARWRTDLQRRNRMTALGWRIVHVTWDDLERAPDELLRLISCPR